MIPFIRPTLPPPDAWLPYLAEAYERRWFTNFGPVANRLERALTERYGGPARQAILTANGTAGLTAALMALGIRGSVVVPSFTFPATAQAVLHAGCQPLLCDVSPETWETDPLELARLLARGDVGGVVHVRAFGLCRDLSPIEQVARQAGIPLIVDAAAALGGCTADGRPVGNQGDMEVFSLHATKVFGVGEGGVVFAPAGRVPALRRVLNFGIEAADVATVGLNGKFSEFHAAVGMAVLDRIDAQIAQRRHIARTYAVGLGYISGLFAAAQPGLPPWQTYPLLLPAGWNADALVGRARQVGVELRRYYAPALHETTLFHHASAALPCSEKLSRQMVCLPVYSDMTEAEAQTVLRVVRSAAGWGAAEMLRAA